MKLNPATYSFIGRPDYKGVHNQGFVWATIFAEVFWNLVDRLGFKNEWYHVKQQKGNIVFLQLFVDALKLQPCRPSFLDARNAFVLAETVRYHGEYHCDVWKGFAKRGLGWSARPPQNSSGVMTYEDAYDVPLECK
jgi:extracellular elastinolytic metalloproteinase